MHILPGIGFLHAFAFHFRTFYVRVHILGLITTISSGGEIIVLFASLPMISSSNFSMPEDVIFVLSVTLPTISTTTDPGPPNA